jgi:hypothetical protein
MTFDYLDILRSADFSDDVTNAQRHITRQYLLPILGYPYNMQMNAKYGVCTMSIFWHTYSIPQHENMLKLSPKGEGFNPPKSRQ